MDPADTRYASVRAAEVGLRDLSVAQWATVWAGIRSVQRR
jgi:hypothetical protein